MANEIATAIAIDLLKGRRTLQEHVVGPRRLVIIASRGSGAGVRDAAVGANREGVQAAVSGSSADGAVPNWVVMLSSAVPRSCWSSVRPCVRSIFAWWLVVATYLVVCCLAARLGPSFRIDFRIVFIVRESWPLLNELPHVVSRVVRILRLALGGPRPLAEFNFALGVV